MISQLEMHEDMPYRWKDGCDSNQCPWWSISYDTCPNSKRLGFDPSLSHRIFRIISLLQYKMWIWKSLRSIAINVFVQFLLNMNSTQKTTKYIELLATNFQRALGECIGEFDHCVVISG